MGTSAALIQAAPPPLKFQNPDFTLTGKPRAEVALTELKTLFINTGSLCNIECAGCYMESGPKNDRLAYITAAEVRAYLDEIARDGWPVEEIGFTGGEPFMNPDMIEMLDDALARGFRALVLTNAMKPLWNKREKLLNIVERHGEALTVRVSVDHYSRKKHEDIRGENTWDSMIRCVRWLAGNKVSLAIAGRTLWGESEAAGRAGYRALFEAENIPVDSENPQSLVLFPEMDAAKDAPEISAECWDILDVRPSSVMCASSRMVVKRKGASKPVVLPCTLLPYGGEFEMGERLADARDAVKLNHHHCATFCVLGGASCNPGG